MFTDQANWWRKMTLFLEIERTDRCCSETEPVTAQICSGRNRTEPHTQICASCRGSLTPQTRDVQILKCCVRISPRILTTDPHPHSPQAPSRSRVSSPSEPGKLGHRRTINGCSCGEFFEPCAYVQLIYISKQ